ncbi:MAG: hypothetical protein IT371_29685 [Deltaproteobacteria bacterium]|nr:hypothetical protein [Deltaproteobacteria bacterium]
MGGDLNLYAYVSGRVLQAVDPVGLYATIYKDKYGVVQIRIPILFQRGDGVVEEEFERFVARQVKVAERVWTGTFGGIKVRTRIDVLTRREAVERAGRGEGLNVMTVHAPSSDANAPWATAAVWSVGVKERVRDHLQAVKHHKDAQERYRRGQLAIPPILEEDFMKASTLGRGEMAIDSPKRVLAHEVAHLLGISHDSPKPVGGRQAEVRPGNVLGNADALRRPNVYQVKYIMKNYCQNCQRSGGKPAGGGGGDGKASSEKSAVPPE